MLRDLRQSIVHIVTAISHLKEWAGIGRLAIICIATGAAEATRRWSQVASGTDGVQERRGSLEAGRRNQDEAPQSGMNGLPKHSYWLDLWLFILFDLALFVFVYLLP
ncbi:uncharacterized protein C4orf3 homolog [Mus caroli]|uniref:Uncharacterized protein C4orf3 homolog n=1 Tax=Mus caroli TaxID=10089 RepID=A0A6P5P7C2_MUSCR|nr:uncharacterized protein C4orf3 homolog [Mus caroli]